MTSETKKEPPLGREINHTREGVFLCLVPVVPLQAFDPVTASTIPSAFIQTRVFRGVLVAFRTVSLSRVVVNSVSHLIQNIL